jgi:hypothetical protein
MEHCGRYSGSWPDGRSVSTDISASQEDVVAQLTELVWRVLDAFPDARKALQDALRQELRIHEQSANKTDPSP